MSMTVMEGACRATHGGDGTVIHDPENWNGTETPKIPMSQVRQ